MSNRFSDWFNKVVGKTSNDKILKDDKSIEPILPHEVQNNINNSDYDAYAEYAALKKKLHVEKVFKQVETYDTAKQKENPEYKSMAYNVEHELNAEDINEELDEALDMEQAKKMEIYEEQRISEHRKKELQQQEIIFNTRREERNNLVNVMRAKMADYDAKQNREGYKTYEESCRDNDENSDREEDEEMSRVLQEKLGVYDAVLETPDVKEKRKKKQAAIDDKLKIENQIRQENIAEINRKMNNYHEQNKYRSNYVKFDGNSSSNCLQLDNRETRETRKTSMSHMSPM
jgi:hypothetical protein